MLTVIKQHEDRNVIVYDYYIEDRQNVYVDTGHITVKAMGGFATWRAINDQNESPYGSRDEKKSGWRCLSRYDKSCAWREKRMKG